MPSSPDRIGWRFAHRREYLRTKSRDEGRVNHSDQNLHIGDARTEIVLACAVIAVPMLFLSAILLGLILYYNVQQPLTVSDTLSFAQAAESDDTAFYVDFSATRLITVASWTSSVAPVLPTFFMSLLSYSTAQSIMRASADGRYSKLPTPYQLSLLLSILGAEIGSLWQYTRYRRWRRRDHIIGAVSGALSLLVVVTFMG